VVLLATGALIGRERYQRFLAVTLAVLFVVFIVMAGLQPG
jgi:hypothetical protein